MKMDIIEVLVLLPSLAETEACQWEYTHICTMQIPSTARLRYPVYPVAASGFQSAWLLEPEHRNLYNHSPVSIAGTDHHTHRYT